MYSRGVYLLYIVSDVSPTATYANYPGVDVTASIVMGDDNTLHDLFLVLALLVHLQLGHTIARRAALTPFKHRWCILVRAEALDAHSLEDRALGEGDKLHVVVGLAEVEHAEALVSALVDGRLDDAVDCRPVVTT